MIIRKLVDGKPSGEVEESKNGLPEGYCIWIDADKPMQNDPTKEWVETIESNGDFYEKVWVEKDITFDDTDKRDAAIALKTEMQWAVVRDKRDYELSRTDWYQFSDTTDMPANVKTYRQALRDITKQSDPFDITWPDDPLNLP